jgi:hypothetical protein
MKLAIIFNTIYFMIRFIKNGNILMSNEIFSVKKGNTKK